MFENVMDLLGNAQQSININTMINLAYAVINIRNALENSKLTDRERRILEKILDEIIVYLESKIG